MLPALKPVELHINRNIGILLCKGKTAVQKIESVKHWAIGIVTRSAIQISFQSPPTAMELPEVRRPTLVPSILITPPPEDEPTSNLSILTSQHWALWARGRNATRRLDRVNARGRNYEPDEIEIDAMLPLEDDAAGKVSVMAGSSSAKKTTQEEDATAGASASIISDCKEILEVKHHLALPKPGHDKGYPSMQSADMTSPIIDRDRQVFDQKNKAVLDYIKFRGKMMREYEEKYGEPWYNVEGLQLPVTGHLRSEAEDLLTGFAANPIPDLTELRDAEMRGRSAVWKAWNATLDLHRGRQHWMPQCVPSSNLSSHLDA